MPDLVPSNFTRGVPAPESFPSDDLLAAGTAVLRNHAGAALQYGPASGFVPLREWLGEWQGVEPRQVLTANGSLQIVEFLCVHTLRSGDVVLTESPTYDRTITLLRRHGVQVIGIPLEPDGPDLVAPDAVLQRYRPKLFYVIPDFQNPAGATCSFEKRRRIVELAEQHGFLVLEDAPYRLLRYRGEDEPTLFSLAPERVLQMASFTKLIAPGVRVGYLLGDPRLIAHIAKVAEDTYISPGYLAQAIAWEWCRRGLLPSEIERLKRLYAPRLEACVDAIDRVMPDAEPTRPGPPAGSSCRSRCRGAWRRQPCGRRRRSATCTSPTASHSSPEVAASASSGCLSVRSRRWKLTRASAASGTPSARCAASGRLDNLATA